MNTLRLFLLIFGGSSKNRHLSTLVQRVCFFLKKKLALPKNNLYISAAPEEGAYKRRVAGLNRRNVKCGN